MQSQGSRKLHVEGTESDTAMGGFANGGEGRVDDVVRGRGFTAEGVTEGVEPFL